MGIIRDNGNGRQRFGQKARIGILKITIDLNVLYYSKNIINYQLMNDMLNYGKNTCERS